MEIQIKEMSLESIDYRMLKPIQGDLKILTKENYGKLKKSFNEKGMFAPLLVWKNGEEYLLLDGHGRERLFQKEHVQFVDSEGNLSNKLPCLIIEADSMEDAKQKLLLISSQFQTITQEGFDAFTADLDDDWLKESVSFDGLDDFDSSYLDPEDIEEDEAPKPPAEPITKIGDLYQIGNHRLLCGDATLVDDVQKLMGQEKANLVWTDPPYNVSYEGKTKDALKIKNDEMKDEDFFNFLYDAFSNMLMFTSAGGGIYISHADSEGLNFRRAMKDSGWLMKQCLIWEKHQFVIGRQDYHWKHEPILYGWAPGDSHHWYGDRKQTTIIHFNKPNQNSEHPTMKPVGLVAYCIQNSSKQNDLVLDLFGGSGTTLIACEQTDRRAYVMELDPRYCDVIISRWEKLTGQKAQKLECCDNL